MKRRSTFTPLATPTRWRARAAALCGVLLSSPGLVAQCQLNWQPGTPLSGPSGRVTALGNLPNGDMVAAGWFLEAGAAVANRVARFDGSQWHALGSGVDNAVHDMVVAANGDVYVGGEFTMAGGAPASRVARWDGSSWSALGQGLDNLVTTLKILPNGNLLAGGTFQASGQTSMPMLAQWDGSNWSQIGSGLTGGSVGSIAVMPNGGFAVGGGIFSAGGTPVSRVAIWDGANWSGIPGLQPVSVTGLAIAPSGKLAIGGIFVSNPGSQVLTWDGNTIQSIANGQTAGSPEGPPELIAASNGDLFAISTNGGSAQGTITRWNGATWMQLGGLIDIATLALLERPSGALLVGGGTNQEYNALARTLKSFDGTDWIDLGARTPSASFVEGIDGELYAGTGSNDLGGGSAVQRWNGTQWQSVGSPIDGYASGLAAFANGGLLAGGVFPIGVGGSEEWALRWDGLQWAPISAGLPGPPTVVAAAADGSLFAGFQDTSAPPVMTFDGSQWNALGTGIAGRVFAMAVLPNGDLVVGGDLTSNTGHQHQCMQWDGTAWTPFGTALPGRVTSVLVRSTGEVIVAPNETGVGSRVLVGTGGSWTQLGGAFDNFVFDLASMPNGDVIAAGRFHQINGQAVGGLARWNGSVWTEIPATGNGSIGSLGLSRDGSLHVSGGFSRLGGLPSAGVGRAITTCPADTASYGNGCIGPAGPVVLAGLDSPWVGSNYRTRAYGMPVSSVAVHAVGFAPVSVALPPLLPQSLPGCQLLTSGEILDLVLPNTGVAEPQLQLPNDASLVGATFYQQVLAVQIGAGGTLLSVSSSNGLEATIGSF